jgi:transcription elongation factor Elf1
MRRRRKVRKMNNAVSKPMNTDEQLFTVSCVNCNNHIFKFSQNMLEEYGVIFLRCPECGEETEVTYNGLNGIDIKQTKHY